MQLLWASSSMSRATEVRYRFWCFTGNGLVKTRLLRYWTIMSHPISVNQWKGRPTFPPLCLLDDVLQTFTRAHLTLEVWKKSVVPWIIVVEMSFPAPLSTYSPYNYWVCVFSKGRGAVVFWVSIWVFTNPIQDVLTSPKWESGPAWQNHKSLPPPSAMLLQFSSKKGMS